MSSSKLDQLMKGEDFDLQTETASLHSLKQFDDDVHYGFAIQWPEDYVDATSDYFPKFSDYGTVGKITPTRSTYGEKEIEPLEIYPPFLGEYLVVAGEEEAKESEEDYSVISALHERRDTILTSYKPSLQDHRRRSLFVHSVPTHFPDVNRARKSVFGTIFLRTTARVTEEAALLRTLAESNYSMLQSLLSSFDKIIADVPSDADRKEIASAYKESILKSLETHGISRTYSDGSVQWDIYPITQSYLFSIQVGDHIHLTRNLSQVEDRIVTGQIQRVRFPYSWPTNSQWAGNWDSLGMAGSGTYTMPHGVVYSGKMKDGMFHDDNATLTYPNKFRALHCVYDRGRLLDCQFQFPDLLLHEKENWGYCQFPDRRFWSEVRNGLKPAKIAQKTEVDPPRKIPPGCYDTNDGFYNPKDLTLLSPSGKLLRVPVCEEGLWIKKYCRKGFQQPAGFRPDLFENWFDYDYELIEEILLQQENYRKNKISYDDLQQFYADHDLLPYWSKYKKRKTAEEIALEEHLKSIPEPVKVKLPRFEKKYDGLKLLSESQLGEVSEREIKESSNLHLPICSKKSKSFIKFNPESKFRLTASQTNFAPKTSKISFKLANESAMFQPMVADFTTNSDPSLEKDMRDSHRRKIPERFLEPQPIARPLFQRPEPQLRRIPKSCLKKDSVEANVKREGSESSITLDRKKTKRFIESLIMKAATVPLLKELERDKRRLLWATKIPTKPKKRETKNDKCLKVLQELFESIPERDEYCDSDPSKSCDFKKLAEDKYNMVKYWGMRIFNINFSDKKT